MPLPPQRSSVMEPARRLRSCTASPARSALASTTRPCMACRAPGGSRPATSSPSTSRPSSAATWRTRPSGGGRAAVHAARRATRRDGRDGARRGHRRGARGPPPARDRACGRAGGRRCGLHRPASLSGHGIGRTIDEPPDVLNYDEPRNRGRLTTGLVITIEPIISAHGELCGRMPTTGPCAPTTDR